MNHEERPPANPAMDHGSGISREGTPVTRLFRIFVWLVPSGAFIPSILLMLNIAFGRWHLPVPRELLSYGLIGLNLVVLIGAGICEGFLQWRGRPGKIAAVALVFVLLQLGIVPLVCFLAAGLYEEFRF